MKAKWCGLNWSEWIPLRFNRPLFNATISKTEGLYRIAIKDEHRLAYIGQTGRSLYERVQTLARGVYGEPAPWNDPHTAAPCLWAWRKSSAFDYEVSVASTELSTSERQCLEDFVLFSYRNEIGHSTLANHGHFHPNWQRPSNKKQGHKMLAIRSEFNSMSHSLSPLASTQQSSLSQNWGGLSWSNTKQLCNLKVDEDAFSGLYKIMSPNTVVYIGESNHIGRRLKSHQNRFQGSDYCYSLLKMPNSLALQRREREADFIGLYFLQHGVGPLHQY